MTGAWRLLIGLSVALAVLAGLPASRAEANGCTELVADGGFEAGGVWQLGASPVTPQYVTYTRHTGNRALALGITSGGNQTSFSSARQVVSIPAGPAQVTLTFWFYAMTTSSPTTDYMEMVLLNASGTAILAKPWYSHNDSRLWNQISFDLTPWRGQTVQLYFNVYNDGLGGVAALFLDDVSLTACPAAATAAVTPTGTAVTVATPTATSTAAPICAEAVADGRFDSGLASWQVVGDPAGAAPVSSPVRSAPYALKLGSLDVNLNSPTTVRQLVAIPTGYPQILLDVWVYTQSQAGAGADYQQIALLNSSGGLLFVPWQVQTNNPAWAQLTFNVSMFAGQTVFVSFSVNNDGGGGRTAMYVDDVRLTSCLPDPVATATATPPMASPSPTGAAPTGTPVAPGCLPLLSNGSFETGLAPWQPATNLLPAQLVTSPALGGYAVQLGTQSQNLHSYSSIRQAVTVPASRPRVLLQFWSYTWAESLAGADRQQFSLLKPDGSVWVTPWLALENSQTWQLHLFDLIGLAGQSFSVYFNALNDGGGGRTALFVDDVRMWACTAGAYPAELMAPPAPTPVPAGRTLPGEQAAPQAVTGSDLTRVAVAPVTQYFAGTPVARGAAPAAASTEPASLLSRLNLPSLSRLLPILLGALVLVVLAWWLNRK